MSRPNLDHIALRPGEREELERFFAYTEKFREDVKRDPALARQTLERIGYFEMMEDERREKEEQNGTSSNGAHANGDGGAS